MESYWKDERQMRSNDLVKWVKGPAVLDVGCAGHKVEPESPYWLHGKLTKCFPDTTGIDISVENIEEMRQLGFSDLHMQSAEDIQLEKHFDTIIAGELIEHLSNPGKFLQSATVHLARGGRILLTTPYPFSLAYSLYALKKFPKTCQNSQHTVWICPSTLSELASRFGLRIVHWELIEDYRFDNVSRFYGLCARIVTWLRWLIPNRLRCNHLLAVLEREHES